MCIQIPPIAVKIINMLMNPVDTKSITLANTDTIITINDAAANALLAELAWFVIIFINMIK